MGVVERPALMHGEATCELAWRRWLASARCPERAVHEWLSNHARLVIVAPHPDDEILACGGLIAMHVAQGGRVLIVAVTDGEASHADPSPMRCQELAAIRRNERVAGLRQLGVSPSSLLALALEDGKVQQQSDSLFEQLMSLLQRDDVVVSTWENDGHPDHDATGGVVRRACTVMGCAFFAAPVWMWHWATPGDARVPWRRLRALPLSFSACSLKQVALAAHLSQLGPRSDTLGPVLGEAIVSRASWRTEYFFV